ncbi:MULTISPECIES: hypothetical protein [unclassified Nocardiopsis]|uniref:hypothetical protein n=1 Tax=unclassified Nocardiopsis TaxID=2649073 RepID=UPI0013567FE0|nr:MULTISPECIES: hypothetical protein [unclassified Nocardiopsis]
MDTPPFEPDAVLIHREGTAHRPGCFHNDDRLIRSGEHGGWGWVSGIPAERWLRISPSHPLKAAEGDTSRLATKRCAHCPDR